MTFHCRISADRISGAHTSWAIRAQRRTGANSLDDSGVTRTLLHASPQTPKFSAPHLLCPGCTESKYLAKVVSSPKWQCGDCTIPSNCAGYYNFIDWTQPGPLTCGAAQGEACGPFVAGTPQAAFNNRYLDNFYKCHTCKIGK